MVFIKRRRNIKNVVLINPPMTPDKVYGSFSEWAGASPPTGLCYIAAYLRKHGYSVHIVDAEALRIGLTETVSMVKSLQPDIVGIACKTLWIVSAHGVAKALKEEIPDVPIVAGGNHVTAIPERSLNEYPSFDMLVIGEGEVTFKELIEALNSGDENIDLYSVCGIAYREGDSVMITPSRNRVIDLDQLPPPAFDLLPDLAKHYVPSLNIVKKVPAFSLVTSRGCPFQCTFCDRKVFGNKVTRHSPRYLISIVKDLYHKHGIRYLLYDDDIFTLSKKHLIEYFDLQKKAGLKIPFTCQSRVDTIDEDALRILRKADCRIICYGVESGSERILRSMKKKINVKQVKRAVKLTKKEGIEASGFFILGYPGETEVTLKETEKCIRESGFNDIGVFLFTPLPGSEIYENVSKHGRYNEDWQITNALDHVVFIPFGLTQDQLLSYSEKCYNACYVSIKQILFLYKRFSSMAHVKATVRSAYKMVLSELINKRKQKAKAVKMPRDTRKKKDHQEVKK